MPEAAGCLRLVWKMENTENNAKWKRCGGKWKTHSFKVAIYIGISNADMHAHIQLLVRQAVWKRGVLIVKTVNYSA